MAQNHNAEYIEKPMTRDGRIQGPSRRYRRLRHPTFPAAEWTAKNPLLQRGEFGIESDTHRIKAGDGLTYWNDLPYISDAIAEWGSIIGDIDNQTDLKNALDGKVDANAAITGATHTKITYDNKGLVTSGSDIALSDVTDVSATATEVNYLSGVTSNIQNQIDSKADKTNRVNGAPLSNVTSSFYGTSDTAAATVQKEVSIPSITNLDTGTVIIVQPTVTSTVANSTLKLNNFDAYPMRYNNAAITTSTDSIVWNASYPSIFVFDGTYWVFAGHGLDSNTTYTLNYSVDAGQYTAGSGTYAVTRYSILAQKADGTWEKITATNATYSTGTSKSVNTSGFILNQLRYYGTTTTVASGVKIATNVLYEKAASVDMRYSTNCGATTTWALGDYIYLVGTIGADGLFYLDTTTWWANALPTTNDGKLYIRLGLALAAASYTMSFFEDRPIFYHDGTGIKEYKVADNKQDVISDLATIRSGASAGATAVQPGDLATVATTGDYDDLLDKPTIPTVNDATLTINQGGVLKGTFTANASSNTTIDLDAGGGNAIWGNITGTLSDQTDLKNALDAKQDTLTAGSNISISGTTISATDTTYTGSDGITLTGTNFTNSGVRSVASGTTNGTISVNTNGISADVSVTGLGSAAYTASSDYATAAQGTLASTAVQPGDLATVATTGDYDDLLNKPTIPAAQVNSDWDAISGVAQILNKPTLGTAAAANTTDFATAAQGTLASTALQPGDDVSDLNNDAGYQTAGDVATAISGKQDTLTAGTNVTITGTTISATDTTYSAFTGATAGDAGTSGLVPAPAAGDQAKFLQGDGTWANPTAATAWGNITGTLSDQTDLQNALSGKANTGLDNLTSIGKNIGNWSSNVTNCITEIPQDINIEWTSSSLTIKAGSKIYIPNGTGTFNEFTFPSDVVLTNFGSLTSDLLLCYDSINNVLNGWQNCFSGSSAPTGQTNMLWYDTTNNAVKSTTNSGSTWNSGWSLPLALISHSGGLLTNVKNIFNGFGYIGSTVFVLPGVKGLFCNGRNTDGTLSSVSFEFQNVSTYDGFNNSTVNYLIIKRNLEISKSVMSATNYDEQTNYIVRSDGLFKEDMIAGIVYCSPTAITAFIPKQVFHAVDYNDTEYIAHQSTPSGKLVDLTVGTSGTSYTMPANGYLLISASSTATNQSIQLSGHLNYRVYSSAASQGWRICIPVSKGEIVTVNYNMGSIGLKFSYSNGAA